MHALRNEKPTIWRKNSVLDALAAGKIQQQDVLLMDTGTTVLQVARHIPESIRHFGTLRIATNSTLLLNKMGSWATPNLLLLGGIFLPEHWATVGPEALASLQQISADRAILGCDGLTLDGQSRRTSVDRSNRTGDGKSSQASNCSSRSQQTGPSGFCTDYAYR